MIEIIASVAAVTIAGIGLTVSLWKNSKKEVEENATRVTKLEEDVKDLKSKHTAMVNNVDKLNESLARINTKQAIMEVKLDQLQKDLSSVNATCNSIELKSDAQYKAMGEFMLHTSTSLMKVTTEISMLNSSGKE